MEFNSNKPIFITIKEHYEHLIDQGALKEGMEMPSVREVALVNGVNPNTVQRAFSMMVEDGYLVSIPKKGFFVSKGEKNKDTLLLENIQKLLDDGYTVDQIKEALDLLNKGDKQ